MKDVALLLGVTIILGGVGWYLFNSIDVAEAPTNATQPQPSEVESFADCVAAGNSVMESYPRQCRHGDQHFIEDVSEPKKPIACTADAKLCPDGSAVGRTGPDCSFAPCPTETVPPPTVCSPESKLADVCTMEYAPVCGLVEVQCVTTPCPPIPETFGNACAACGQGNAVSYTPGACSAE